MKVIPSWGLRLSLCLSPEGHPDDVSEAKNLGFQE